MSVLGKIAAVVLGVLLTTTLGLSLTLGTAHLTVLDPEFVSSSVEEEGGYELVQAQLEAMAANATANATDGGESVQTALIDEERLLERAVGEEYLAAQSEHNVEQLYAYLHGNSDTLNLSVDVRPIKRNASAAVEAEVRNTSMATVLEATGTDVPGPVNATLLARLTANESGYQEARTDFRAAVRDRVLDRLVDEAYQSRSNDELLALVIDDYDPRDYTESEKEQMVADRETEIKAALRDVIESEEGDRIDGLVDDQLATAVNETEASVGGGGTPMERAAGNVTVTLVQGLAGDQSYETFRSDLDEAKAELATVAGDRAYTMLDEQFPDRVDVDEQLGAPATSALDTGRTAVTWLDRLTMAVPLVLVGVVGLLYWLYGSAVTVTHRVGAALVWTGLPTYLSLGFVADRLRAQTAGASGTQAQAMDVVVGVFEQILGTLGALSLSMTVVGVVFVGAAMAVSRGWVDAARARVDERVG